MNKKGLTGDAFIDVALYIIFFIIASFGIYYLVKALF
jgi:hypothetical protein